MGTGAQDPPHFRNSVLEPKPPPGACRFLAVELGTRLDFFLERGVVRIHREWIAADITSAADPVDPFTVNHRGPLDLSLPRRGTTTLNCKPGLASTTHGGTLEEREGRRGVLNNPGPGRTLSITSASETSSFDAPSSTSPPALVFRIIESLADPSSFPF